MGRSIVAVCALVLAACGSSSENLPEVEVQVINGVANSQDSHLTLRVTTPRETERKPFPHGDSTNPANWAIFHLSLLHADVVEFALEGGTPVSGTCIFDQPASGGYARVIMTPLDLGGGRHLDCGEGFLAD
jgi:hypothetical protein